MVGNARGSIRISELVEKLRRLRPLLSPRRLRDDEDDDVDATSKKLEKKEVSSARSLLNFVERSNIVRSDSIDKKLQIPLQIARVKNELD